MGGSGFRSAKLEPLSPISLVAVSFDSQSREDWRGPNLGEANTTTRFRHAARQCSGMAAIGARSSPTKCGEC